MSKFLLSTISWSTIVGSVAIFSSLSNFASAQQTSLEGLPSFPGFTQSGASQSGATQTGTAQAAMPAQVTSQPAFSEQQLINSMPNALSLAGQNPNASQVLAAAQSPAGALVSSEENMANATASLEDAHASQMESTLTELEAAHAHAYNTLAAVLEKVPADARPAIQQAMEQSRQGYQKARDNRERVAAHKLQSQSARRSRLASSSNGANGQQMQAGQHTPTGQHASQHAGQQPNQQQGQHRQQGYQGQQGYAGQRPNAIQGRTVSGPSQTNFGTAQFNSAQGNTGQGNSVQGNSAQATQGFTQGTTSSSMPGLIEGPTSVNSQPNQSTAQPGSRNYSTPEMNRAAPGRPLINGVNGTTQGNNFGVPANQRNPNLGAAQPGSAQGSPGQNLNGQSFNGQSFNGQGSNGPGMSRPAPAEINRYNQPKPNSGYNSQGGASMGSGATATGNNPGFGSGTRQ